MLEMAEPVERIRRAEIIGGRPRAAACLNQADGGSLFRLSQAVLLCILCVAFAGCLPYFEPVSPVLLFGTYLLLAGCIAVCLCFHWPSSRNAASIAPYLGWLLCYFLWGMLVSPNDYVVREGAKVLLKNALIAGAVALAIDRRTVKGFAQLAQIAVLCNLAVCFAEVADPGLVEKIARAHELDATAFNILRPAGLWSNPDEAAFALVFALLLSRWAAGLLGWLGRGGAVVGIFLGASRTGAYLLALCGAFYAWLWLRTRRRFAAWIAVALAAGAGVILAQSGLRENWQVRRFLDFAEETRDSGDVSRVEIARDAIHKALNGPWYGNGLFAFQSNREFPAVLDVPAHNIYLAVWGETGVPLAVAYLLALGFGFSRVFRTPLRKRDAIAVGLMWLCYLVIGFTWHNQFTSFAGMLYIALLFRLPDALALG